MAQHPGPQPLPTPLRAALGVIASIADAIKDGRGVPDRVLELPVLAVSTALQLSLRAQQHYTALTVRGDELLTMLRGGASDDPPAWAQFDDQFDDEPPAAQAPAPAAPAQSPAPAGAKTTPAKAPAKAPAAKKAAAKRTPAKTTAAKKTANKTTANKTTAKRPAAKKAMPRRGKSVPTPRTGNPSAFDLIGD
jgi:hypothetical protein